MLDLGFMEFPPSNSINKIYYMEILFGSKKVLEINICEFKADDCMLRLIVF